MTQKRTFKAATERGAKFLANNLNAIAEDKRNECTGGCAHTPLFIVAECGTVNGMVAKMLTGEAFERPSAEQRQAYLESFDTTEKALAHLSSETQSLLAAIDSLDESSFGDFVQTPIGERTVFGLAELPMWHMSYHDGQLNYLQTLHNDAEMHWD